MWLVIRTCLPVMSWDFEEHYATAKSFFVLITLAFLK